MNRKIDIDRELKYSDTRLLYSVLAYLKETENHMTAAATTYLW